MKTRRTRQLATICDVVSAAHDHPTAEEVYARVRRRLPRISLGTVYRNLQKLAEQQQLRVVHLAHRPARYDGMLQGHDHFLCERCGMVADLAQAVEARPECSGLSQSGYQVRAHALTFYGLCPECRRVKGKPHLAGH
ncbi:MAG: Fur family transcriptional regulator [Candidatus Binatia bacterium]